MALCLTSAELAVGGGQEALVTQAAEGPGEVLTAAVETHAGLLALVDVWRRHDAAHSVRRFD